MFVCAVFGRRILKNMGGGDLYVGQEAGQWDGSKGQSKCGCHVRVIVCVCVCVRV